MPREWAHLRRGGEGWKGRPLIHSHLSSSISINILRIGSIRNIKRLIRHGAQISWQATRDFKLWSLGIIWNLGARFGHSHRKKKFLFTHGRFVIAHQEFTWEGPIWSKWNKIWVPQDRGAPPFVWDYGWATTRIGRAFASKKKHPPPNNTKPHALVV